MIVYTGGTFDLFHVGHARLLKNCWVMARGGKVIVSVNTDEFALSYKNAPVCSLEERMEVVGSCRWVDKVIVNYGGADSKPAIESVGPDLIIIGDDWADKDYYKQMGFTAEWLDEHNIKVRYVPYTKHVSTTIIKNRLRDHYYGIIDYTATFISPV